ncbi:hypothetical protein [Sphingobacterium tabacisoli]|uniref:Uncharacterized protein n=1 Tax=Sphingobacterium tabacisoli TaxID=2044855 RepID=A0ABW5LAV4_9SPHI|nr:hypothetical protein [Sphingobacterium tabacisoli]
MDREIQLEEPLQFCGYSILEIMPDEPIFGDIGDDKCWLESF